MQDCIEASAIRFDVGNLKHLVSLVRSVIRPKAKSIGLLQPELDHLCINIVKAWLKTVPDNGDTQVGEVIVKVLESGEEIRIFDGLLYPLGTDSDEKYHDLKGDIKVK